MERKLNLKKMASVLLTLMVTISMMTPSMLSPKEVSAKDSTITGQCYIHAWTPTVFGGQQQYFTVTMPDGAKVTGKCIDLGMNVPIDGYYNFTGTLNSSGTYDIVVHSGPSGPYSQIHPEARPFVPPGLASYPIQRVGGFTWSPIQEGYAKLKKITKSNKHLTDLCPEQYTLAGAEYGVYSDSGLSKLVGTLKTNANGDSNTLKLEEARYFAKETKAPKGYKLDPTVYTLDVKAGETSTLNVADEPLFDPLQLKIQKRIEEGADKNLTLEGAEYTVKYYKDFLNKEEVKTATPFRTWVFSTKRITNDVYGFLLSDKYKVGGDEFFRNEKGNPVGLRGTYVVEEIKAPKGLARTEGIISLQQFTGEVVQDGTIPVMKDVTDIEKTQKINIKVQKKDAETGEIKPQGYGSFAGAKFNVWFYDPLQLMDVLVGTIVTNENGTGELVKLAPGLYTIEEIEAPAGYNKNPSKVKIEARVKELNTAYFEYLATIAEKPITVTVDKTSINEVGAKVSVKGAKLELYKIETGTSGDGEHKMSFIREDKIEEWVSDGTVKTFKALPKGNYVIKEVEVPKGYLPLEEEYKFEVKEVEEVQKHEVFNEAIPEVNTVAKFDTGAKESLPKEEVTVLDKFEYKKVLKDHPYEIKAKLVEKDNVSNVIAEDNKKFTAEDYKGEETLKFTFNAKELEGKRLVVLTELHRLDRKGNTLVAVHKDINNIDETVVIPEIKTTAKDKKDGGKDLLAGKKETIVDKVSYTNLIIGRKYKVSGKLMNKETGKPVLDNGKEVTAEKEFTAETSNGFVNLEFTFNATALAGKTVVVFEDVYQDKIKVATHTEITDKEQSIYIPKIGTKLTGKNTDEKEFHAFDKIELRDTMKYENLIKGKVYYAKGEVINKKTGKTLQKAEGNFIADEESGEVSLDFTINAKDLKGSELVCFEEIYTIDDEGNSDKLVALHKDINDKGQTVKIVEPKIGTQATADNGKKEVTEKKEITITDKVAYQDLIIGKEYTIKGKLMDKSTGKALAINGKEITAEKKFTAKEKSGFEELTFTFDGTGLGGKTVVVFEDVYEDGKLIGTHSDINDLGQSIKIIKKDTPKTGDKGNYIYYLLGLLVAGGAITYIRVKRERK